MAAGAVFATHRLSEIEDDGSLSRPKYGTKIKAPHRGSISKTPSPGLARNLKSAATIIASLLADRDVLERAQGSQSADRRSIDVVGPRHVGHRLTRMKALYRFLTLVGRDSGRIAL